MSHRIRRWCYFNCVIFICPMASPITSLTVVYSTVHPDADQRKHQSSAPLAFVWGPVNSPHKGPVTRKMYPFDDVIMLDRKQYTTSLDPIKYAHNFDCYFCYSYLLMLRKTTAILQNAFWNEFLVWKVWHFDSNFTEIRCQFPVYCKPALV